MTPLEPIEVRAVGLTKRFGDLSAVQDVSFTAPAGAVTALLGGNGAGKSTTLRLMLGLSHGGGRTTYGGRRLVDWPAAYQQVGIFLGAPAFHPGRTARDHLRVLASGTAIGRDRVDEVLAAVGLAARAMDRPRGFSTGMRQRLGLAAALLADPSVLVLDEPINGLDPHGVIAVRELLAAHARRGGTVILASHILSEVVLVADRVVMVAGGRVVGDSTLADLLQTSTRVLVRSTEPHRLAAGLDRAGGQCAASTSDPDELAVSGLDQRSVAEVARDLGILVWELTAERSLESVYLERVGRPAGAADSVLDHHALSGRTVDVAS